MSGRATRPVIGPLPAERVAPGGDLRQAFLRVEEPWRERGLTRWFELVRPDGPWPVAIVGAWPEGRPQDLQGTIVAVWAPRLLARFDDLLEASGASRPVAEGWPRGGAWHFIAVTTLPTARGTGLGRRLARAALGELAERDPSTTICTLSPAIGLARLAERVDAGSGAEDFRGRVRAVLLRGADEEGRPLLPIQRFHLGNGATLGAILFDSRRDDSSSGRVTLRFHYPLDPEARRANLEAFGRGVEDRRRRLRSGKGSGLPGGAGAWLMDDPEGEGDP